jgi:hypothetical protein
MWEYESLFLGSKKQLIICKNYKPILRYLERYRLPSTFEPKKVAMQSLIEDVNDAIRTRNELWSEDREVSEISEKIEALRTKMQEAKAEFFKLVDEMFTDFRDGKRKQMSLRGLRVEIMEDIKRAVDKAGLFYREREASKLYWEVEIQKEKYY